MCKTDSQCPAGQRCVNGTCAATARGPLWRRLLLVLGLISGCASVTADTPPSDTGRAIVTMGYSSKIGNAEGADSDFAADPPAPISTNEGPAGYAATTAAVLEQAAQGQGGRYGKPRPILEQAECEARRVEAEAKVPNCAAEMLGAHCSRGDTFRAAECPRCAELVAADSRLAEAGCSPRPEYPTLRDK